MSVESTRETLTKYFNAEHSYENVMAEDAVFTDMSTGQEHKGPEAILGMLTYFYHQAFDARADLKNLVIDGDRAITEWDFVGKHIGEFAGVSATGNQVRVPLAVAYDLENDKIKSARIYFQVSAFLSQV